MPRWLRCPGGSDGAQWLRRCLHWRLHMEPHQGSRAPVASGLQKIVLLSDNRNLFSPVTDGDWGISALINWLRRCLHLEHWSMDLHWRLHMEPQQGSRGPGLHRLPLHLHHLILGFFPLQMMNVSMGVIALSKVLTISKTRQVL
jgi:hypothetical protein